MKIADKKFSRITHKTVFDDMDNVKIRSALCAVRSCLEGYGKMTCDDFNQIINQVRQGR